MSMDVSGHNRGNRTIWPRAKTLWLALVFLFGLGLRAPGRAETADLIAFLREDGVWLVNSDGTGLLRVFEIPTYMYYEEKGQRLRGDERLSCAPA
jgi:hypothetical protein